MKKLVLNKFLMATLAITLATSSMQAANETQSWWRRGITAVARCCSRTPAAQAAEPAQRQAAPGGKKGRTSRGKHNPTETVEMQNHAPIKPWLQTRKGKCALAVAALASIAAGGYFVVPLVGIGGVVSYFNTTSAPLELPVTQTKSTLCKSPKIPTDGSLDSLDCDVEMQKIYAQERLYFSLFRDSPIYSFSNGKYSYNDGNLENGVYYFKYTDLYVYLRKHASTMPRITASILKVLNRNFIHFDYLKKTLIANEKCNPTLYNKWIPIMTELHNTIKELLYLLKETSPKN